MITVLSWGFGVESTAILVRWLLEPETLPCSLDELIVLSAQTGDEYEDTRQDAETYILPILRRYGVRLVQVARHGHLESDGITVLSDTREPYRLHIEGDYKLSDELRAAGTVPQFGGEHICSLKFKAFPLEFWLREHLSTPYSHAFGYSAEEPKRVAKCQAAEAKRMAFGFNIDEHKRVARARQYDTPSRESIFPLVEWGWTRADCITMVETE
ncbi:hypothetical protein [Edaphobacter modestus]|uniref:Uncharacterized protein n=1 Tax=Edaphobacter modestus TaxID=388466 RepID=A0A4Q7XX05_9BACT|nr:hypothetical protein [Edaphobacter modestus]RZU28892.1 hypothetical protein BDD14_6475 [Edaphobacter modestus]